MQEFEKYPKLTEHIQEMANTGRVPREWTSFLYELNEALKISSKPVLADSLPTQCIKEWENSDYCSERGKCQKCL